MRRQVAALIVAALAVAVVVTPAEAAKPAGIVPVASQFRITSVKNLGNTVGDDSTDRIEVKWDIANNIAGQVKEYIVEVKVVYGDGTSESRGKTVSNSARSAEVRVPFKSTSPTKSFDVKLTAVPKDLEFGTLRTAKKAGNF
jgi:hypothetical protein